MVCTAHQRVECGLPIKLAFQAFSLLRPPPSYPPSSSLPSSLLLLRPFSPPPHSPPYSPSPLSRRERRADLHAGGRWQHLHRYICKIPNYGQDCILARGTMRRLPVVSVQQFGWEPTGIDPVSWRIGRFSECRAESGAAYQAR